ncbi:MAG TPA: hypothetical protein VIM39_05455 [Candidatus Limnocylindrales bacterium]
MDWDEPCDWPATLRDEDGLATGNVVEGLVEVTSGSISTDRSHAILLAVGDGQTIHRFTCPVCGYPDLYGEPRLSFGGASYEICPSCGQFGVSDDDDGFTFEEWRSSWVGRGMPWSVE